MKNVRSVVVGVIKERGEEVGKGSSVLERGEIIITTIIVLSYLAYLRDIS